MGAFLPTLLAVATLLAIASGGFILKKRNMLSESCIPGFSKVLLYVCQPCLVIYTFAGATLTNELLYRLLQFFLMLLIVHILMLGGAVLLLWKRSKEPIYRVITLATTFANCAFFAIPLIEALMPDIADSLVIYTSIYGAFMNIIGWTAGIFIITRDKKYISPRKMLLNPAIISLTIAVLILLSGLRLPTAVVSAIQTTGRTATPLSMLIMGMRLATMRIRSMFVDVKIYITVFVKHFLMALIAFCVAMIFGGFDPDARRVLFITCSCPIASVVLNYAELAGVGQDTAANLVLFSTIFSIVSMPPLMLLLQFIV